jgi:tetratricopeptide (TPR) repeat protein
MVAEQLISPFVFFSYAHTDEAYVSRLLSDLQTHGIPVWIDRTGIPLGTRDWEEAVRTAIAQATAVVLFASPQSRISQIVRGELDVALLYERPVYLFWIYGEHWIESIPLFWGRTQRIDARQSRYEMAQMELVSVLKEKLRSPLTPDTHHSIAATSSATISVENASWSVPYRRNRFFTGREHDLSTLHEQLTKNQQIAVTQAISGLGGVGKTQLVIEYAYHFRSTYRIILWVQADTQETLLSDLARLAPLLDLPEQYEHEQVKVAQAVKHWMSHHSGWLLILDNVENLQLVEEWTPVDHHGAILLTTRQHETEPLAQTMVVNVFSDDDGTLFLLKRVKRLALHKSLDQAKAKDVADARVITQLLGGLPLALDQAGAYIIETKCSLPHYAHLFKQQKAVLLQRRGTVPSNHPQSVMTTFTLAFEHVQQKNEATIELLKLCAYLAPDAIPLEVFAEGAAHLGMVLESMAQNALLLDNALETLQAYSLIRRDEENRTITIHRLVQSVLQETITEIQEWKGRVIVALDSVFPYVDYKTWDQCSRLVPHAALYIYYEDARDEINVALASLLYKTARYFLERAQYKEVETFFRRALEIQERILGTEHVDVARTLNNLAIFFDTQGKHEQALPLYKRALSIQEHLLGAQSLDVATTINNLATLYHEQEEYEQAQSLYQRALAIRKPVLPSDHPHIVQIINNLAALYHQRGKYDQAEILYLRIQAIDHTLEPNDPSRAATLDNLAELYKIQGKYIQAETLYLQALAIREHNAHPDAILTLNNLAELYYMQEKYQLSEIYCQKALQKENLTLPPEYPYVAFTSLSLANLYVKQGKYHEAEPLYERALSIREQTLGAQHSDVAYPLHGLANLYKEWADYDKAEGFYLQALQIVKERLGELHSVMADIMQDYAGLQTIRGKRSEAKLLYQRVFTIRRQVLGNEHKKTRETQQCLDILLNAEGMQKIHERNRSEQHVSICIPLFYRLIHPRKLAPTINFSFNPTSPSRLRSIAAPASTRLIS